MSESANQPIGLAEVQALFDRSPFISFMQLQAVSLDHAKQEITCRMPMRPEWERRAGTGQWHGGPMAALIDTAGDFAYGMLVGGGVPTINFRVDYLRPAINTSLTAVARVRRAGKTVALVDVDVLDESGKLLAVGRGTYSAQRG